MSLCRHVRSTRGAPNALKFSGNDAPEGSGLWAGAGSTAYLTHTTVASNTTGAGVSVTCGSVEVYATLLANHPGNNCAVTFLGTLTNAGNSMSSDATCGAIPATPGSGNLKPLALNGGPTLNHALLPGNPAVDQVAAPCAVSTDQRGVARPQGGNKCDVGAFELEGIDLVVSKSADPSPVLGGQTITYTVVVTNNSANAATNVVLTDTLLGGASFGGVVSGGFTPQSSTITQAVFTLLSLPAGSSATLIFTATAPASGAVTNTVTVAANETDVSPANNTFTVVTPVTSSASVNLTVTKAQQYEPFAALGPNFVRPGDLVTYTIVVTNNGSSNATGVMVTDTLAAGLGYVSAGGSGWSCSYSAPTVSCAYSPSLAAGSSATVLITVTAPITPGLVTNVASAAAGSAPPVNSNAVMVRVPYSLFLPIVSKP